MKHVLVLGVQVPFVRGGAELLNESLVKEINKLDDVKAELVYLPFKWYPEEQILNNIMAWRLLDLSEANGTGIDLVIATKFPAYALRHNNKVIWLVHQHRVLYDLENTVYDTWSFQENSKIIRNKIRNLDNLFFKECKKVFTIADTVSDRLKKFNRFESISLLPPPVLADKIKPGKYGDYILYVGRLDPIKRVDLFIKALAGKKVKAIIAGNGLEHERLKRLITKNKLENRCKLAGFVTDEDLIGYLSNARAVYYAPLGEDYGYATIEAFLAKKPVITCSDSGEVEKIVTGTKSGIVCDSSIDALSKAIDSVYNLSDKALEKMSINGWEFAKKIKWDRIIQNLVVDNL